MSTVVAEMLPTLSAPFRGMLYQGMSTLVNSLALHPWLCHSHRIVSEVSERPVTRPLIIKPPPLRSGAAIRRRSIPVFLRSH